MNDVAADKLGEALVLALAPFGLSLESLTLRHQAGETQVTIRATSTDQLSLFDGAT